MAIYRDEVVVLRLTPFRERDRIVHTLSRARGRLGLVARSARSPRGALASRLAIANQLEVTYHRGPHAELGTLRDATVLRDHQGLQGDLAGFASLEVTLEVADHLGHDDNPEPDLFAAVCRALDMLHGGEERDRGIVLYLLAALAGSGLWGGTERCEHCGRTWEGEVREIPGDGHALWCGRCAAGRGRPFPVGLLKSLGHLALRPGDRLRLTRNEELRAVEWLTGRIEAHTRRRLKSIPFLYEVLWGGTLHG
ncbi:MAG: DNA repair protein RecO [Nitrospirota bacterium]|jgi:DNA repair protein RecO (recombination protein O)